MSAEHVNSSSLVVQCGIRINDKRWIDHLHRVKPRICKNGRRLSFILVSKIMPLFPVICVVNFKIVGEVFFGGSAVSLDVGHLTES